MVTAPALDQSAVDASRMSTANRDLINLQTLNDDLRTAYQESSLECQKKDEEIAALHKEMSELRRQLQASQRDARLKEQELEK